MIATTEGFQKSNAHGFGAWLAVDHERRHLFYILCKASRILCRKTWKTQPVILASSNDSTRLSECPPLLAKHLELVVDPFQFVTPDLFSLVQNPNMLLFQVFKILVQPFVPWVEDEDLEAQCRSGNDEIGQGDSAREYHGWMRGRIVSRGRCML